jgi:hypothetical protein
MEYWRDMCTKASTGICALCDALAERDRFIRFWFQGGLFIDGVRALKRRGIFAFLSRHGLFLLGGLVLLLTLCIPSLLIQWSLFFIGTWSDFLIWGIWLFILLFLVVWKFPQWHVAAVSDLKDRIDLS